MLFGPPPAILPHDPALYAGLRLVHTVLALALFATVLAHPGAGLMHALMHDLIFKDGAYASLTTGGAKAQ